MVESLASFSYGDAFIVVWVLLKAKKLATSYLRGKIPKARKAIYVKMELSFATLTRHSS